MSADTDLNVRIPSAVYRALYPQARVRGVEVGALLVELALGRLMRETQPVKVHPSTDTKATRPPCAAERRQHPTIPPDHDRRNARPPARDARPRLHERPDRRCHRRLPLQRPDLHRTH